MKRWRIGLAGLALLLLVAGGLSSLFEPGRAPDEFITGPVEPGHNCRFWGAAGPALPDELLQASLVDDPNSMRSLSVYMRHGWCLMHLSSPDGFPVVDRGRPPAHQDPEFDDAVAASLAASPTIAIAHVRYCSSGLCDIPNPHPFTRYKHGRHWFMGHNGTISKQVLVSLIRPDYLAANPPVNGENIDEWIDSELYFLFFLQCCEDRGWSVKDGFADAVQNLRLHIPGEYEALNVVFTDGETLFAYRQGISLYYLNRSAAPVPYTAVASIFPPGEQGDWVEMADGELISIVPGQAPLIENIEDYFDPTAIPQDSPAPAGAAAALAAHPNPFNPATTLSFSLAARGPVTLAVYDLSGRLTRTLIAGQTLAAGEHEIVWRGRDDAGRALPSGVYIGRLEADGAAGAQRLVLIK